MNNCVTSDGLRYITNIENKYVAAGFVATITVN